VCVCVYVSCMHAWVLPFARRARLFLLMLDRKGKRYQDVYVFALPLLLVTQMPILRCCNSWVCMALGEDREDCQDIIPTISGACARYRNFPSWPSL